MKNKYKIFIILFTIVAVTWLAAAFFNQDKKTAEEFAIKIFSTPLPPKTKVLDRGFDYGVTYGGGPSGSGGYPTVVVYQKLYSELSEKEVAEYYKERDYELYFDGDEELKKAMDGKRTWYEGKKRENLSSKDNTGRPIEFIVQVRTEFDSAFGDLAR